MKAQVSHSLPPPAVRLIGERELAARLGISIRCAQEWRLRGTGPKFVRLGERRIAYNLADVEEWVAAHTVSSTAAVAVRA
jgi:predicted DNA-binding transcriptional regulator AlpA